jgi:hypothetical protein
MKSTLYGDVLHLNGGQVVVNTVVLHLLVMIAQARERHKSSLVAT